MYPPKFCKTRKKTNINTQSLYTQKVNCTARQMEVVKIIDKDLLYNPECRMGSERFSETLYLLIRSTVDGVF